MQKHSKKSIIYQPAITNKNYLKTNFENNK